MVWSRAGACSIFPCQACWQITPTLEPDHHLGYIYINITLPVRYSYLNSTSPQPPHLLALPNQAFSAAIACVHEQMLGSPCWVCLQMQYHHQHKTFAKQSSVVFQPTYETFLRLSHGKETRANSCHNDKCVQGADTSYTVCCCWWAKMSTGCSAANTGFFKQSWHAFWHVYEQDSHWVPFWWHSTSTSCSRTSVSTWEARSSALSERVSAVDSSFSIIDGSKQAPTWSHHEISMLQLESVASYFQQ